MLIARSWMTWAVVADGVTAGEGRGGETFRRQEQGYTTIKMGLNALGGIWE